MPPKTSKAKSRSAGAAARSSAPKRSSAVAKSKRPAAKKAAPAAKKPAKKAAPAKKAKKAASAGAAARRADYGAPVEAFVQKQPAGTKAILEALRSLVAETVPDAGGVLKWGMPNFAVAGGMVCALAAFKSHVNFIVSGPPHIFADPEGLLEGGGKTGRHLKIRSLDELPRDAVVRWLLAAAENARAKA
jgi:hypothetical protein